MNIRSITKVISNTLVGIVFQLTFSQSTMAAEVYHYVPHFTPQVTTPPTTPSHLSLISDPNEWTIPVGTNACYSWHMGSITNNLGSGSFGWATGFYPPVANQLQSTTSDSGFQSYDDERGIYIATTDPSANGVLDIQCGKYYGQAQAFYPWDYPALAG